MVGPDEVDGRVLCDAVAASCRCRETTGHYPATPHVCPCSGSWRGDPDADDFEIITLPQAMPIAGLQPW